MLRRLLALTLLTPGLVLVAGALPASAAPTCTDTYTPPSSGTTGNWATVANWSTGLPTSTDVACWSTGVTVTFNTTSPSLTAVTAIGTQGSPTGPLVVSAGMLNVTGQGSAGSFVSGLTNTSIIGTARSGLGATQPTGALGDLTVSGPISTGAGATFSIGSVTQTGGNASTLAVTGTGVSFYGCDFTDQSTSTTVPTIADLSDISLSATNATSASLTLPGVVMGDHTQIGTYGGDAGGTVTITGPISKPESNGGYTDHAANVALPIILSGNASVSDASGNLQLGDITDNVAGGATFTSTATDAATQAGLSFIGNTHIGTVSGSGKISLGGNATSAAPNTVNSITATNVSETGNWQVLSTLTVPGTLSVSGSLEPPATSTVHNLTLQSTFGPLGLNAVSSPAPVGAVSITGTLDFAGGTLGTVSATQSAGQTIVLNSGTGGEGSIYAGTLTTPGAFVLPTGKSFSLSNGGALTVGTLTVGENATFGLGNTAGTTTVTGSFSAPYDASAGNHIANVGGPLALASGATASLAGSGATLTLAKGLTIASGASFSTDAGTTVTSSNLPIVNNGGTGTINGTFGSGSQWHQESGSLSLPAGSDNLDLTNDGGTLTLPAGATNLRSFTQGTGGTLPVRVTDASTYDSLVLKGNTLPVVHGHIAVTDQGGFTPTLGNVFHVVTCASCTTTLPTDDASVSATPAITGGLQYATGPVTRGVDLFINGVPNAPSITTVDQVAKTTARVTFAAPSSSNGSAITHYTFTCTPSCGPQQSTNGTVSPFTLTGLTPGTAYSVSVTATNGNGTGAASNAASFTTLDVPGAPTNPVATPGDGVISVTFTPPASNGGSPITTYTVTASCNGSSRTGSGSSSPVVVGGLTDEVPCTVTVTATNAAGTSMASTTTAPVTPAGPAKPVVATVTTPSPGALSVYFTQATGGTRTTSFTATCTQVGGASTGTATGTASPLKVTGLLNNTNYTCTVQGLSVLGRGLVSNAISGRPGKLPTVTITITAGGKKATKVKTGTKLTIKGTATVGDKPAAGRAVTLVFTPTGKKTATILKTLTTTSKGAFTFTAKFSKAGGYQVRLALGPATVFNKTVVIKRAS